MKSPSFPRFLNQYCLEIAGIDKTSSIRRLTRALPQHTRLLEPLTLFALVEGREELLIEELSDDVFLDAVSLFIEKYRACGQDLETYLEGLPENDRFRKVHRSWLSQASKIERDRATLVNVSESMRNLIESKGLSRAQACRITGLDKGNFYAFLKGDTTRMSRSTAMQAYRMLESA